MADAHDIAINGSGNSGGGTFKKVSIRGEGTITDHLTCESFRSYGTSTLQKDLNSAHTSIYGESTIEGKLVGSALKLLGQLKINARVTCQSSKIRGRLEIGEGFKGDTADVKGQLTAGGDVELEKLSLFGSIQINGLLNAGHIDLQLKYDDSRINEIGGEFIQVKRKSTPLPFGKSQGSLQASLIEGDDLHLEYTKADIVRGKRLTLGKGCEIGVVEYSENLKEIDHPVIKEKRKL